MKGEYDRHKPQNRNGEKVCPWCGEAHRATDEVVTVDGRKGVVSELAPAGFKGSHGVRLYHYRCLRKRNLIKHRAENKTFDEVEP